MVCTEEDGRHRLCSGWDATTEGFVDWPNPHWTPSTVQSKESAARTIRTVAAKMDRDVSSMF